MGGRGSRRPMLGHGAMSVACPNPSEKAFSAGGILGLSVAGPNLRWMEDCRQSRLMSLCHEPESVVRVDRFLFRGQDAGRFTQKELSLIVKAARAAVGRWVLATAEA